MKFLVLVLFVFQLFSSILCYELGYNNLVLIEEGKSVEVNCLPPKELPENIIKSDWYNITEESVDPYNHYQNKISSFSPNPSVLVIDGVHSMFIENARSEVSGYYSCELQFVEKSTQTTNPLKRTKYRLHLIEVTKHPSLSTLKAIIFITLYAKFKTIVNEQIYILIEDLLSKKRHQFENNVEFNEKNVLCQFDSNSKLTKCEIRMNLISRNKCHKTNCSLSKEVLSHSLKKDLKKIKNLLKLAENDLKKGSNDLIEIDIRNITIRAKPSYHCPEGYYFGKNQCRPCHSGHYKPYESEQCITCPINTYNPYFGQSSCFHCPPDTKTMYDFEGATLQQECKYEGYSGFFKDFFSWFNQ